MSHDDFAQIWYELERRADLDYILREAVGNVFICPSNKQHDAMISTGILAKLIFDLQRYNSLVSSIETQQFLTFDQLAGPVRRVARLAEYYRNGNSGDQTSGRTLYRQAFASGIRVLLIRANTTNCNSTDAVAVLEELYRLWPFREPVDNLVLRPFLDNSIQDLMKDTSITDDSAEYQYREATPCTHRDPRSEMFPNDIYRLRSEEWRAENLALRISDCLPHCVDKHQRFWEWMDFELVFLVSSYQLMGCSTQNTTETDCHHLGHDDREINTDGLQQFAALFSSFHKNIHSGLREYQLWVRQLQYLPYCLHGQGGQCFTPRDDRVQAIGSFNYLPAVARHLHDRAQAMTVSTKAIDSVFEGTRRFIANIYSDPEAMEMHENDHSNDFVIFALSCPQAHIIHYHHLYRLLYNLGTDTYAGLDKLQNHEDDFEVKMSCPFCGTGQCKSQRLRARKILALSTLPSRARAIPPVKQPTIEPPPVPMTPPPHGQPEVIVATSPNLLSVYTGFTPSPSSDIKTSGKRNSSPTSGHSGSGYSRSSLKKIQNLFSASRSSVPSPVTPQISLKIALSSDATAFVAYTSELASVYSFLSKSWSRQTIHMSALSQAAAGPRYFALVNREDTLELFENVSGSPIWIDRHLQTANTPIRAMCFSRDGTLLALSTERVVTIINLADEHHIKGFSVSIRSSKFPRGINSDFDSQVLSFTPDATHLCVSTRYLSKSEHSGELLTILFRVTEVTFEKVYSRRSIIAHHTIDNGLTAVACVVDGQTINYLVCSSNNAGDTPYIWSWNKEGDVSSKFELYHNRDKLDTKLQNAVSLGPHGGQFVVVVDSGQIFLFDRQNKSAQPLSRCDAVYAPGTRGEYKPTLQIASENATNVRVVWWENAIKVYDLVIGRPAQPVFYTIDPSPFHIL